jgi:hydroxypyruvate isomerase
MRLSGCIETLFVREHPSAEERIRACAKSGLYGVEFWRWSDKSLEKVERALGETGLALTFMSNEPRLPIVDPATHRDFIKGLRDSVRVATRLKASGLGILVDDRGIDGGDSPRAGVSLAEQHAAIVVALKLAAPIAADSGLRLYAEPLNSVLDHKGHFLDRTPEGLDIVEEVGHPHVLLLYDMYHSTMMGERPDEVIGDRAGLIGHVHVADVPGRHEPGSGTIDWPAYMATLAAKSYQGPIGLEYFPTGATLESLHRARKALSEGQSSRTA